MNNQRINTACRRIRETFSLQDNIVITSHQDPDGDGLGSEATLAETLLRLGKHVRIRLACVREGELM